MLLGRGYVKTVCHWVSLQGWLMEYLTWYWALFSDWNSTTVEYEGKKNRGREGGENFKKAIVINFSVVLGYLKLSLWLESYFRKQWDFGNEHLCLGIVCSKGQPIIGLLNIRLINLHSAFLQLPILSYWIAATLATVHVADGTEQTGAALRRNGTVQYLRCVLIHSLIDVYSCQCWIVTSIDIVHIQL